MGGLIHAHEGGHHAGYTQEEGLDSTRSHGHPQGRRLPGQGGEGPLRADLSENARQLRLHDHREDHPRPRGRHPRVRQEARGDDRHGARLARGAEAPLPALGALRHQGRHLLHVPGDLRHGLRQVHRGRRRALLEVRHRHRLREPRGFPQGLEVQSRGLRQVRARAPVLELPRIRRVSVRDRGRDQEGPAAQGGLLGHARSDAVSGPVEQTMLEFEDIQHILLTRTPALTGRYEFLSFSDPAGGRAWLSAIIEKAASAADVKASVERDQRWVTVAFTWNGLRALGVDDASLSSFPEEFKQGMAARAEVLGDTGVNHPDHWVGGLASPELHAIAILFARDGAERVRCKGEHEAVLTRCPGVKVLSSLDLEATPPFEYAHDHFGYRDRLSQPVIEGSGEEPTPGSGAPLKAGEFILGYPDEHGHTVMPQPETLTRNGSYMAYRRLEEHVGKFRDFLREHGKTAEEQELVAAKLMGRWRSGAPLMHAPAKDDPALGADPRRNNDFNYKEQDPHGYAVPLGSHIRRMNPRDTAANMNRRRMIRRGATYGPALPEGAPDDGVERGIAAFVICANLIRQYEFAQNVWTNDPNFHELGNERDPIIGAHDGTFEYKIPKRPIRKTIKGLPSFTTVRGGAYFFLPGLKALRWLAAGRAAEAGR